MNFVALAAIVVGVPGVLTAMHLGLLAIASWWYREPVDGSADPIGFLVLIPAHNEERLIGAGLEAIMADLRDRDTVLVVADRCTDRTAEIARAHGAAVLERGADETPGRAAARQAGLDYACRLSWDAVLMLDADSVIEPGFFDACERAMVPGVDAVQARSESRPGRSVAQEAALAAFTVQGITIPRGRDRLGVSVRLRGTGMAIRREIALAHEFRAPASEDLFFTLDLLLDGVRCRHVDRARLRSQGESAWGSFGRQKLRYEAGRMMAARQYAPRLLARALRARDASCFEAAWFLVSPPFATAASMLLVASALAAISGSATLTFLLAAAFVALVLVLVTGLIQARAAVRTWIALAAAPWYLVWKVAVQIRALGSSLRRNNYYEPTARA